MKNESVLVAITMPTGDLFVMCFATRARGNVLPQGAVWINGGVPGTNSGWWYRKPTDAAIAEEVARAHGPVVTWRRIEASELPLDRVYRPAWYDSGKRIEHDMAKAREWHRQRIRKHRVAAFQALDGRRAAAIRAKDSGLVAAIDAKAKEWADAPADPRIEAAQTVEELRAIVLPE